jgi:hypothetical protein
LLLEAGADANPITKQGDTPLMIASMTGDLEVVRLLLEHGADPSITAEDDVTALSLAREGQHEEVVRLLETYQ